MKHTVNKKLNDLPHNPMFNSLPNDEILDWSILEAFADEKIKVNEKLKFGLRRVKNHCGKGSKCWLTAFSSFPIMFSKVLCFRVIKSRDRVLKG